MAELTDAQKVLRNDTGKRIAAAIEALGGTPPINLGMTGASVGQVPVINTVDANGAPTSYRPGSGGGGGGGTSDYNDLSNKPSINNVTLSGNKTAADLGLGTYTKPSGGIPQTDLASAVQSKLDSTVVVSDTQPTATENKLWVDTDAGSGSTYQVPTVAEMEAEISSHVPLFMTYSTGSEQIAAGATREISYTIPSIAGYTPYVTSVHITDTSIVNYAKVFLVWQQSGTTLSAHVFNTSTAQVAPAPRVECLYLPV